MSKEQDMEPLATCRAYYPRLLKMKLPENLVVRNGFLCKGNLPAALVTSGIVEAAAQGFLQVDDPQEYETG
ncbi:hypothetical protein DesLBE_3928 [Desulfitobacterium sp. LBE]|uniref:Uncharacterized protein n=1 Tax=bioreactor metagenome TaxID=1076179 RepID=A0A644UB60_9ZZZZ|nr:MULTISPECIES: hypothetical protein [Desulfitobacterium]MEA5022212.1 hypothetical protein [Desulfitobacterium hafniense]TWH59543.1 hypothetical protein DesLBE_3928 [Desulfitobacterium sp. LBE]